MDGVDLAAMIPAIFAVSKTSPLGEPPFIKARKVFCPSKIRAEALATRLVTALALISTIPANFLFCFFFMDTCQNDQNISSSRCPVLVDTPADPRRLPCHKNPGSGDTYLHDPD